MNQNIIACGKPVDIGTRVVLWSEKGGFVCPNKRGRINCTQHDPALNDAPTQGEENYRIENQETAYRELQQEVYQLVLHYDVCYCSWQCHQVMRDSTFKGSQFYLDIDGTLYQTCDLYWKTNTGPADDRIGNERSVHVEMANLSWEALKEESTLYNVPRDQYQKIKGQWQLLLPEKYRNKIRTPNFTAIPSRTHPERGYLSRRVNDKMVRMWDYTEEQYLAVTHLARGINKLLPGIKLKVPFDKKSSRVPLDKIRNFSSFAGILGHCHIQKGNSPGVGRKYDPGSAFNWGRLRKELLKEDALQLAETSA
jgi:hypothetical protein